MEKDNTESNQPLLPSPVEEDPQASYRGSPLVDIVAGSVGGMASVIVGQPFDVVKVRQQIDTSGLSLGKTITKIWETEGGKGFFKGLAPPLVAESLYNCLYFGSFSFAQSILQPDRSQESTILQASIAGSFSGIVGSVAISPVDLIKVRLQVSQEVGEKKLRATTVVRQVLKEEGFKGFYRGYSSVFLRESTCMGVYFGSYESLKRFFRREDGTIPVPLMLFCGGTAGIATWLCNYPVDVIKTTLQSSTTHSSIKDAAKHIMKTEGMKGFYKGIVPCLARAFPVNGTVFTIYEITAKYLNERFFEDEL